MSSFTAWYMDVEVYLRETGTDTIQTSDSLMFPLGPYVFPIGASITVGQFVEQINAVNATLASDPATTAGGMGYPMVLVWPTPYLVDNTDFVIEGALGAGGLDQEYIWTPVIDGGENPAHRKLSRGAIGFDYNGGSDGADDGRAPYDPTDPIAGPVGALSRGQMGLLATEGSFKEQMLVRYDISIKDTSYLDDFIAAQSADLEYYGFKLYFRTGPYEYQAVVDQVLGPNATVTYKTQPDVPVVDLPYGAPIIKAMQDDFPLPPNIQLVPTMGVSNSVRVLLNSNTGEYEARPVVILAEDLDKLVNVYINQKPHLPIMTPQQIEALINDPYASKLDYPLSYRNDDPVTEFELFRLDYLPESYTDFDTDSNPHALVNTNVALGLESDGAIFMDDIVPNKKYYYCARALDIHKNFSNPTHVFEVEMVDNEGEVYMILKTIILGQKNVRSYTKSGRRFIYIEPSLPNLTFDPDLQFQSIHLPSLTPASIPATNILGTGAGGPSPSSQTVWNKTFKIRVVSKKTSRKFDLNITMKNTGVENL